MDVGGAAETPALEGGGRRTRRRRGQRRTRVAQEGGGADVAVEKADGHAVVAAPAPTPTPLPVAAQKGGAAAQPKPKSTLKATAVAPPTAPPPTTKVVIAPPKKKAPKLLFVPKNKVAGSSGHRVTAAKTFKARRVSVTIDNTAKTQKRRRQTVQKVEGMSVDQLRGAAVAAKLSRRETVEKVPADLLRQMLKDYYMMRGMLV